MQKRIVMMLRENGMGQVEAERLASQILEMLKGFVNGKLI
jgi:hypothetical protein